LAHILKIESEAIRELVLIVVPLKVVFVV